MTDIVERLRGFAEANRDDGFNTEAAVQEEAADEIERLRVALREIAYGMVDIGGNQRVRFDSCDIARRALENK